MSSSSSAFWPQPLDSPEHILYKVISWMVINSISIIKITTLDFACMLVFSNSLTWFFSSSFMKNWKVIKQLRSELKLKVRNIKRNWLNLFSFLSALIQLKAKSRTNALSRSCWTFEIRITWNSERTPHLKILIMLKRLSKQHYEAIELASSSFFVGNVCVKGTVLWLFDL